jgi:F-type H+-transporting ATPase subunit delta
VVSGRYALALYELSKENSDLDKIEQGVEDFLQLYKSSEEIKYFIKNPTQDLKAQLEVVEKISKVMNFSTNLKNFICVLINKRRIFYVEKILQNFLKLLSIKRGEINASLISSRKLTNEEVQNISKELSESSGTSINFKYSVDESLIGGLKIQLGSLLIDSSIKNRLQKYQQLMIGN